MGYPIVPSVRCGCERVEMKQSKQNKTHYPVFGPCRGAGASGLAACVQEGLAGSTHSPPRALLLNQAEGRGEEQTCLPPLAGLAIWYFEN